MKEFIVRSGLVAVLIAVLLPGVSLAQYPTCEVCNSFQDPAGRYAIIECTRQEGWGYENCWVGYNSYGEASQCRAWGAGCYYMEVYG